MFEMKNINFLLLGTYLSLVPHLSQAQCVATQDCTTLGYTENSCSGGSGIKCPFGNKWACLKNESEYKQQFCEEYGFLHTCSGTEYAGGIGKACNGKYTTCNCLQGYEWNELTKECKNPYADCTFGAMYYADNTCSNEYIADKQLLGIVVYEKSPEENGWVMTHKNVAHVDRWGEAAVYTKISDTVASASCTNTAKLIALGGQYKAAVAASNYDGGNRRWCLPSYGVLNNLTEQTNFDKFNNVVKEIKSKAGADAATLLGEDYDVIWSSSDYSTYGTWYLSVGTKSASMYHYYSTYNGLSKNRSGAIRAVTAF